MKAVAVPRPPGRLVRTGQCSAVVQQHGDASAVGTLTSREPPIMCGCSSCFLPLRERLLLPVDHHWILTRSWTRTGSLLRAAR